MQKICKRFNFRLYEERPLEVAAYQQFQCLMEQTGKNEKDTFLALVLSTCEKNPYAFIHTDGFTKTEEAGKSDDIDHDFHLQDSLPKDLF